MLPPQELQTILDKSEIKVYKELQSPKLRDYETLSLRRACMVKGEETVLKGEQLALFLLGTTLELCYQMVGVKQEGWPSGKLAYVIGKHIMSHFPFFTVNDILLAFEHAILEEVGTALNHYGIIDVRYIHNILKEYNAYRSQQLLNLTKKLESAERKRQLTIDDLRDQLTRSDQSMKKMVLVSYIKYLEGQDCRQFLSERMYDFLKYVGLITLSAEVRKQLVEEVKKIEVADGSFRRLVTDQLKQQAEDRVIVKAKERSLVLQFKEWQEDGFFEDMLTSALDNHCHLDYTVYNNFIQDNPNYRTNE